MPGAGAAAARAGQFAAAWAPVAARVLLGLVLAWFGYHELVRPSLWTGYVPVLSPSSGLAVILVLAHGWVLLLLAVALVAGVAARTAAAVAAVLVLEIVISLTVTGGLSEMSACSALRCASPGSASSGSCWLASVSPASA